MGRLKGTSHRFKHVGVRVGSFIMGWFAVTMTGLSVARADAPAVTDFGQDEVQTVFAPGVEASSAMFLTLYGDGHNEWMVRPVHGDAVVSFAGEHAAWRLDHGLSWFVQMPVYVRVVEPVSNGNNGIRLF